MSKDDIEQAESVHVTVLPPQEKPKTRSRAYPLSGGKKRELHRYPSRRESSPAMKLLKMTPKALSIMPSAGGGPVEIGMMDVAASLSMRSPDFYHVEAEEPDIPISPAMGFYANYSKVLDQAKRIEPVMKKLSDNAYYFGLAKYINDPLAIGICYDNVWYEALLMARREGWKIVRGKEIFRNAARLALARHLNLKDLYHCEACHGAGCHRKGACRRCNGTGRRGLSNRTLAGYLETDHKNYCQVWIPRIEMIYQMINEWDQEVLRHLYHQFTNDA